MVVHKCYQETNIALLSKATTDMAKEITEIKSSVSDIRVDLQKVKDFMGTMELSAERNNSDIKQLITNSFSELRLDFEKEREKAIKDTKERTKINYASKGIEKFLIWGGGIIGATFLTTLTLAVMKLLGKI